MNNIPTSESINQEIAQMLASMNISAGSINITDIGQWWDTVHVMD